MSWLSELLSSRHDHLTFEQELDLLCARWQDRSRKISETLSPEELAVRLTTKAQLLHPDVKRPGGRK